ncbi:MAG: hypothetical protein ACLFM0_08485 [Spirochaetales bacterium]
MIDEELKKTADLARLTLGDTEQERLRHEVETVLSYFDSMAAAEAAVGDAAANAADHNADSPGVVSRTTEHLRADEVRDNVNADDLLDSADDVEDRFVAIPNVL